MHKGDGANGTSASVTSYMTAFGDGNPALALINGKGAKDVGKKSKPKNNIVKSNSSFVSRVIPHEAIQKRLAEHSADGVFAILNINRAIQWLDLSSDIKVRPDHPLAVIVADWTRLRT